MSSIGKRRADTTKQKQPASTAQSTPLSSKVAAELLAPHTSSTSDKPRSVPSIDESNVAGRIPRFTELGGASAYGVGSQSSASKSPTRLEDGNQDQYSTAGKNYTLSPGGSKSPVPNMQGSQAGRIASRSINDRSPISLLSAEQQAFLKLDYSKPDAWREFLRNYPIILASDPAAFLKEASSCISHKSRGRMVKPCVQRATVLRFCKDKTTQEIDKWFLSLKGNQKTQQEFVSQADAAHGRLPPHSASDGYDSDFDKPYGWGIVRVAS